MGWPQTRPQTRYAPSRIGLRGADAALPRGIADGGGTFTETARLRTVFVMNDELLCHGLMHVVSQARGVEFVGDLRHGPGLVDRLRALRPELLVLGVDAGSPLSTLLAELHPVPKVVVIVDGDDASNHPLELIKAGADALVNRRSPSNELLNTVLRVINGQSALDAHSVNALVAQIRSQRTEASTDYSRILTRREREVLSLLTEGLDNRAIATKLFISEATVKFHLHNIMDKFGVRRRAALVAAALRGDGAGSTGYLSAVRQR